MERTAVGNPEKKSPVSSLVHDLKFLNQTLTYLLNKSLSPSTHLASFRSIRSRNRMYTLLSGWYKYLTQKEEYYVLVLGLDNAGKTTLLERIKSIYSGQPGLPPHKITPTIGLNSEFICILFIPLQLRLLLRVCGF